MDSNEAWEIVKQYSGANNYSEDEMPLVEEALMHIYVKARELCDAGFDLWRADVEAGAFNLAYYYEKIDKYELAIKYYTISQKYGCDFVEDKIDNIRNKL